MRVLLDTCTLLWAVLSPEALPAPVAALIADERNDVLVSAATACEISTKVRLGKLPGAERLEEEFLEVMEAAGYRLLAIDAASALRAGRMPAAHRDPFDRMIAAQALGLDVPVLTPDPAFDLLAARRLWE